MTDGFTALVFGFCAMVSSEGDSVELGYVSEDKCIVRVDIGNTHGQTATLNEHEVGIKMLEGGAEISIDDLRFVIQASKGI